MNLNSRVDLPDVNVFVALAVRDHKFNPAAQMWLANSTGFATTPITESGLLRVLMGGTENSPPVSAAIAIGILTDLRTHTKAQFWEDNVSLADGRAIVQHLQGPKQVTDVHLLNLAIAKGGQLVTFDKGIAAPLPPALRKHVLELG